jgi:hypothetical protein
MALGPASSAASRPLSASLSTSATRVSNPYGVIPFTPGGLACGQGVVNAGVMLRLLTDLVYLRSRG